MSASQKSKFHPVRLVVALFALFGIGLNIFACAYGPGYSEELQDSSSSSADAASSSAE